MSNTEVAPSRFTVAKVGVDAANLEAFPADYSDAFTVSVGSGPHASEWARLCLGGADAARGVFRRGIWHGALGFDLAASGTPHTLVGWHISTDLPERFVLDADGRLMQGRMVFDVAANSVTWTTMLAFHRPPGVRIWSIAGHVHRALAPRLLGHAATSLHRPLASGSS